MIDNVCTRHGCNLLERLIQGANLCHLIENGNCRKAAPRTIRNSIAGAVAEAFIGQQAVILWHYEAGIALNDNFSDCSVLFADITTIANAIITSHGMRV